MSSLMSGCSTDGGEPAPAQRIPCGSSDECAPDWVCDDGECAQLCNSSSQCPTAVERCDDGICRIAPNNECDRDADCDRPGPCEVAIGALCVGGFCDYPDVPEDTACDDANPCTEGDTCSADGLCGGIRKVCDTPPAAFCDASDSVFTQFIPIEDCDGMNVPCPNRCDISTGDCVYQRIDTPCDNCLAACLQVCESISCTNLVCKTDGICVPSDPPVCDVANRGDGFPCELDPLSPDQGLCLTGECVECITASDCDDGNECTIEACTSENECVSVNAGDTTICSDTTPSDCWAARCGDGTGVCEQQSVFQPASYECRPSQGRCDIAEACPGDSGDCPAVNLREVAGTECRPVADDCDVAESCDGTSDECPTDAFVAMGTVCREADTICDAVETCTGNGPSCPFDQPEPDGTPCNDPDPTDCEQFTCEEGACEPSPAPASYECRGAASVCDLAETCDGATTACPPNQFAVPGTFCGDTVSGNCTVDGCDGGGACIQESALAAAGYVCRQASVTESCDIDDTCNGSEPTCPDLRRMDGAVCGIANGPQLLQGDCQGGVCGIGCGDFTDCPESQYAECGAEAVGCNAGRCTYLCQAPCAMCATGARPCLPDACCGTSICF